MPDIETSYIPKGNEPDTLSCGHDPFVLNVGSLLCSYHWLTPSSVNIQGKDLCHTCAEKEVLDCGHVATPSTGAGFRLCALYFFDENMKTVCESCYKDLFRLRMIQRKYAALRLCGIYKDTKTVYCLQDWTGAFVIPASDVLEINEFRHADVRRLNKQGRELYRGPEDIRLGIECFFLFENKLWHGMPSSVLLFPCFVSSWSGE
jgi:hypothetical protein